LEFFIGVLIDFVSQIYWITVRRRNRNTLNNQRDLQIRIVLGIEILEIVMPWIAKHLGFSFIMEE